MAGDSTNGKRADRTNCGCEKTSRAALIELLRSYDFAQETLRDVWDFAVEIEALQALGLSANDFRWLTCKQYVKHARETTLWGGSARTFQPEGDLVFSKRSCFILTEAGVCYAHSVLFGTTTSDDAITATLSPAAPASHSPSENGPVRPVPHWNVDLRELRVNGEVVKRFRVPSPNQETVLSAFEEDGWPPHIDDPLPPKPEQDPKRRLNDTIKCLNQHQIRRLLHFLGDGRGRGVRWELLRCDSPPCANAKP